MKKFLHKIFQVTPAAGGGTQDANYAVPERTSPTSWRDHAKGIRCKIKKVDNRNSRPPPIIYSIKPTRH